MAEQTVEELVVSMRPDGTEETADALEESGDQFEETAEQSEDSADTINENAQIWDNAMNVIVTGLAVASGGLLSTVPVIGEVFSGLFAVIESIAFQMDSVLRPVLQPITDGLFNMAGAIASADGAWGTLIGVLGTLVTIVSGVLGAIAALNAVGLTSVTVTGALSAAYGVLAGLVTAAAAALGVSVAAFLAIVAAIVAVIAILFILITDYKGMRTKLIQFTMELVNGIIQWFGDLWDDTKEIFSNLVSDILSWWENLKADTKTIVSDFIADVKQWGKDVISAFIEGIKAVASRIGTIIQTEVTERVEGSVVGQLIGGAQNAVGLDTSDQMGSSSNGSGNVYIDGRRVDEQQGRYRKDSVLGRGRQ